MTGACLTDNAPPCARRRTRILLATLSAAALAALAWAAFVPRLPRVIYNPSPSVPVGWYRVDPFDADTDTLAVDRIVLTRLPPEVATLAAQRGYLPTHVPLLKRVGAVAPQEVCIVGDSVRIDGVAVAVVLRADHRHRPLHAWARCRALIGDELFLLSATHPASFDSRYFGPIRASAVLGIARPLRVEERR